MKKRKKKRRKFSSGSERYQWQKPHAKHAPAASDIVFARGHEWEGGGAHDPDSSCSISNSYRRISLFARRGYCPSDEKGFYPILPSPYFSAAKREALAAA